ncbi:uncharacterized protein LOC123865239 [Maniola jurtina]|uniref:uncharacterized protein LOC123865239 n=1 Tax=Maniola jurtina TaxID=191418 RepID=UPI001E68B528|nr:uncharacterized protein LOC123865239 [Maniola jurtina]XP_045762134.1 uncharacterized protein LOC123865239 [Maniola jurtina]
MNFKRCFKFQHELVDNLNVAYNCTNCILVFWNKFQIFLMFKQDMDMPGHLINCRLVFDYMDFEIHQLILAEHLLCLDNEGKLLAYSLNLEQTASAPMKPKYNFQKLEDNILCMEWYENLLFSIKSDMDELFLRIHKFKSPNNADVKLKLNSNNKIANKNLLQLPSEIKREKCLLCCYRLDGTDFDSINQIFRTNKSLQCKQFLIIVSFDKLTLYAILVDLELNSNILAPVKLLTCPSEINSIIVVKENHLNLLISLSAGTVIKQPLNNNFNTLSIAHLNTAIHRITVLNDKIIYTDGITMWVSTNTFSEPNAKLKQLFVKNVKDFTQIETNGKMICTTYNKLVYIFSMNEESSYLVPVSASEYYSAEHLFNNMNYLHRIMEEVEKNGEIIKNIKKEEDYITTLALSNRQDIASEMIQYHVSTYEKYEDILKEGLVLNLTNNLKDYFERDTFCFLIKMFAALQQNFDDVSANIFKDAKIHITILSEQRIIKTISVKVADQPKIFNIVVPLQTNKLNITDITLDIKIVKKIPKIVNCKENLWTAVYCKQVILTPEHFIKTNFVDNVRLLKDPEDSIEHLLYKTAYKLHGHLYQIIKAPEDLLTWSFFVKLPNTYREILQNEMFYKEHFKNSTKAKFLLKEVSSEEFLNSRRNVSFSVLNEKLDIEIINDGFSNDLSSKMIKVSCANPVLALGIRNFFSILIHNNFEICQHGQTFLSCFKIISSLEKTEKAVQKCIDERWSFEEFFKIYEQFQISLCETSV